MNGSYSSGSQYESSSIILPKSMIESRYQLCEKNFRNKNFGKSYKEISDLYETSFKHFAREVIDESLFVKIVQLYFVQVGLLLPQDDNNGPRVLSRGERQTISKSFKDETVMNDLLEVYDDVYNIPSNLLLNLFFIYYSIDELQNKDFLCLQFSRIYPMLDFEKKPEDENLKNLLNFFVFKVFVELNHYEKSFKIIEKNPIYSSNVNQYNEKLNKMKASQLEREKVYAGKKREQQDREKQQQKEEAIKQQEAKKNRNLKYRSLKEIKKEANDDKERSMFNRSYNQSPNAEDNQQLMKKLLGKVLYSYNLSKNFLSENSPIVLVSIILILIVTRFVKVRKINVTEKIKETFEMAFKVSYL